ncbi:hypothetical protein RB195_005177 [Necator americanus]|uniref:C2H2-type domain-containing protein n=1 Tax=Necator americanus TaxID=51031 RepID=A0ABR1BQG1_NECAM
MVQPKQPPRKIYAGIGDLEEFMEKASPRTKALLRKECSVMLQCRCCTNIFRCVSNFVLHKLKYCQNEYANTCKPIVRSVVRAVDAKQHSNPTSRGEFTSVTTKYHGLPVSSLRHQSLKTFVPIRRTNIVRCLMNKASLDEAILAGNVETTDLTTLPRFRRQVTVLPSKDGHTACYVEAPQVTVKEPDPDKVLLVVPQDLSVQYRNMSLRRRMAQPVARKVTIDEAQCVDRMNMFVDIDPNECRCLDSKCSEIRPFKDIFVLAYHVSVKHCCKIPPRNVLPCMMCAKNFVTWETYYAHILKKHDKVRKSHQLFRENEVKKRGRKPKSSDRCGRSMSPIANGRSRDKQDAEAEKSAAVRNAVKSVLNSAIENAIVSNRNLVDAKNMAEFCKGRFKAQGKKLDRVKRNGSVTRQYSEAIPFKNKQISSDTEYSAEKRIANEVIDLCFGHDEGGGATNAERPPNTSTEHEEVESSINPVRASTSVDTDPGDLSQSKPKQPMTKKMSTSPFHGDFIPISDDDDIDVDVCSNAASETIDVVGYDAPSTKTGIKAEKEEEEVSDNWDGISTKVCVNGVDDEDVDQCSTEGARSSLFADFCPQEYDILDAVDEMGPTVQSVYLCGDEDMNLECLADDNDSVDNLSTTVMPKTSTSSGSADGRRSSLRSEFSDESDIKSEENAAEDDGSMLQSTCDQHPKHTVSGDGFQKSQDISEVQEVRVTNGSLVEGNSAQSYVLPAPLANFSPLKYQNYVLQPSAEKCQHMNNSESTVTYDKADKVQLSPTKAAFDRILQVIPCPPSFREASLFSTRQQNSIISPLKRSRNLDETHEHAAKRGVGTPAPVTYSGAALSPMKPFQNYRFLSQLNDPQLKGNVSEHFPSKGALPVERRQRCDGRTDEGGREDEVAAEVADATALPPRLQRCQRSRRLPARYRDGDYVCLLNDSEGGDESAPTLQKEVFKSNNRLPAASPGADTCRESDGSNKMQIADECLSDYKDLSSSQFSLIGTRWNKVFASLRPVVSSYPKGAQFCGDCGCVCTSLEAARRHVLSHIRLVRFVCKLCGVGAFFATDLRTHLMNGLCEYIRSAPQKFIPLTSAVQADSLCKDADKNNPGGVVLFEGESQVVSSENINVHKPDPKIEAKILQRCF